MGDTLLLTSDTHGFGGIIKLGIFDVPGLSLHDSVAIEKDVTDQAVTFYNGHTLKDLIGTKIQLQILIQEKAMIYTIGFTNSSNQS